MARCNWCQIAAVCAALVGVAGCEAANTYLHETGDVLSSGPESRENQAEWNYRNANSENVDLKSQLASLQSEQDTLQEEIARSKTELQGLDERLKQTQSATEGQRAEYRRLLAKQKELKKEIDRAAAAPQPANATDADSKRLELDRLKMEKEQLQKQIQALQNGL